MSGSCSIRMGTIGERQRQPNDVEDTVRRKPWKEANIIPVILIYVQKWLTQEILFCTSG
jgi:hypothetical protein